MSVSNTYTSPLTSGQIKHLLLKNLNSVNASEQLLPNFYDRVFKPQRATMNVMYEMEMRDPSWGAEVQEGGNAPISTAGEGILTSSPVKMYTNSCYATLPAVQDNLYKNQWKVQGKGFVQAQDVLRNITLWNMFNNARNSSSNLGDGQPLLSTQHVYANGVYANTFDQPVSMSKASLSYIASAVQTFTSFAGYPKYLRMDKLEVPISLLTLAQTILFSPDDPTTANRAINSLYHGGYYKDGVMGNPYLKDPTCYFGITNEELNFVRYTLMPPTVEPLPLASTLTAGFVIAERYAFNCLSGRAVYGSTMFT